MRMMVVCLCGCFVVGGEKRWCERGTYFISRGNLVRGVEVKRQQQAVRRLFGPAGLTGGGGLEPLLDGDGLFSPRRT